MPSADSCSNSDLDCASAVRYTLQCEYPERPNFGPDKFGAFFGDVELGRIVQEENGDPPLPGTSTATPTPMLLYHPFTPNNHFTPNGSLYTGTPSDQSFSSSAPPQYDRTSPQYERSAAYVAEQAAFVSEYTELNENPDLRRSSKSGQSKSGTDQQNRLPPDYVRISALLLIIALPCAGLALYWAWKAKKHMKRRENEKAWQFSNKAFYCLLLGLLCFLVVVVSYSTARLVMEFSKKNSNGPPKPKPEPKPNSDKTVAESLDRITKTNSTRVTNGHQDKSRKSPLYKVIPQSSPTVPNGNHNPSKRSHIPVTTTMATTMGTSTPNSMRRRNGGTKRNEASRPKPKSLQRSPDARSGFEDILSGAVPIRNIDSRDAQGGGTDPHPNAPNADVQVPKVTRELSHPSPRSSTTTELTQWEQSNFEMFLNNPRQLPIKTTTIHPNYRSGVPIDTEQAATDIPRQLRHRRNVRQRPRGRRKQA